MRDRYKSFADLSRSEKSGRDFRVVCRARPATLSVIAIHGGGIEPGTSEIADAIAHDNFSFYAFEGIKGPTLNRHLHITSHRFDEPDCVKLVEASTTAIAIHGRKSERRVVYLGGRDRRALRILRANLQARGFCVRVDSNLQGRKPENICNRTKSGMGVQLEITKGLRRSFFRGLSSKGRRHKTDRFREFVAAVRKAFLDG